MLQRSQNRCPDNTVSGVVTLSTCNRLELYAEAGDNDVNLAAQELLEIIAVNKAAL